MRAYDNIGYVFTLKTVNTAVYYPSQTLTVHVYSYLQVIETKKKHAESQISVRHIQL